MRRYGIAALVGLALVASACGGAERGGPSGGDITFSISLAENEKAAVEKLLGEFQQASGTRVTLVTSITAADLPNKLEVEAGRPSIHLFAQDNLALGTLVDRDLVEDLSGVDIPEQVAASMVPERFGGRHYFLPFRPNVRLTYVNTERFRKAGAKPPQTVQELRAVAEKLEKEAGTPKVTLSLAEGDPAAVTISEWIVSYGGDPLVLNDEGSRQAFEFLRGMWKDGLLARESLQGKFDTEPDYLQGETSWLAQNWSFTSSQLAEQDLLGRFEVYEGWRGTKRAAHVVGGDVLGIPKGVSGKQREAAVKLAQFLMSRAAQEALVEENSWPSIRDDAYAPVRGQLKETFGAIEQALEDGWLRPNVPYWPEVSEQMNAAVRRIIQRGEDPQDVLDELHGKIEDAARSKGAEYPPAPQKKEG